MQDVHAALAALSDGQRRIVNSRAESVLAVGAVGSGKTHAATLGFVLSAMRQDPALHLVCGRSPTQLRQEILPHLRRWLDWASPAWNGSTGELRAADHRFQFVAGVNALSEGRFRGLTARCGLLEEAALCGQEFWSWLQTRLRMEGAQLWATTNPEGPRHWLKADVIDGDLVEAHTLTMADNPALPPSRKAFFAAQWQPGSVFHSRNVLGLWAAGSGLIWPDFRVTPQPSADYIGAVAGIDFGSTNNTAVVRVEIRRAPESLWVSDVLVIEGSVDKHVPPSEQARRIAAWLAEHPVERAFVDPSAAPLISELRTQPITCSLAHARNDVSVGLADVARRLVDGSLTLGERTEALQHEMLGYTWDAKLDGVPEKLDDHCCDALRYAVASIARRFVFAAI